MAGVADEGERQRPPDLQLPAHMILPALGVVALAAFGGFIAWDRNDMARARVEGALRGAGAKHIRITRDWMDFDRDTATYDVEYTAADGRERRTTCKVATSPLADGEVFWSSPIR